MLDGGGVWRAVEIERLAKGSSSRIVIEGLTTWRSTGLTAPFCRTRERRAVPKEA